MKNPGLKIKVKSIEAVSTGVIVRGDVVTPELPDGGEVYIRIIRGEATSYFEVGKSYIPSEEPALSKGPRL